MTDLGEMLDRVHRSHDSVYVTSLHANKNQTVVAVLFCCRRVEKKAGIILGESSFKNKTVDYICKEIVKKEMELYQNRHSRFKQLDQYVEPYYRVINDDKAAVEQFQQEGFYDIFSEKNRSSDSTFFISDLRNNKLQLIEERVSLLLEQIKRKSAETKQRPEDENLILAGGQFYSVSKDMVAGSSSADVLSAAFGRSSRGRSTNHNDVITKKKWQLYNKLETLHEFSLDPLDYYTIDFLEDIKEFVGNSGKEVGPSLQDI